MKSIQSLVRRKSVPSSLTNSLQNHPWTHRYQATLMELRKMQKVTVTTSTPKTGLRLNLKAWKMNKVNRKVRDKKMKIRALFPVWCQKKLKCLICYKLTIIRLILFNYQTNHSMNHLNCQDNRKSFRRIPTENRVFKIIRRHLESCWRAKLRFRPRVSANLPSLGGQKINAKTIKMRMKMYLISRTIMLSHAALSKEEAEQLSVSQ